MSQTSPYPYLIKLPDEDALRLVVIELMAESPRHMHNFEVWHDEDTILVNELGRDCVKRIHEERWNGTIVVDETTAGGAAT